MFRTIQKVVLNPFFQALVVASLVILLVPMGLKKYRAGLVEMTTQFDKSQFCFADLDHDGYSERIHTFFNEAGNVGVVIRLKGIPDEQRNFRGIYQDKSPRFILGDYDNDGKDEVYLFTLVDDSVMLQAIRISANLEHFIQNRFIAKLGKNLKDPDFFILPGGVTDMTGDRAGDLVFGINTGFSRYPRNVFIYNIQKDTLMSSPKSGAFLGSLYLENLDEDPFSEIILNTSATDNFNDVSIPYSDSSSWLMVLDHDLDFMFPPVEFPGRTGNVYIIPVKTGANGDPVLVGSAKYFPSGIPQGKMFTFDSKGRILQEEILMAGDPMIPTYIHRAIKGWEEDKMIGALELSGFYEIDTGFNIKKVSSVKFSRRAPDFMDIDMDGEDEIILLAPSQKVHIILRNNFGHPVEFDFPIQSTNPIFSVKLNGEDPPQFSVQGDLEWKLYDYGINPVYRFRFLIYLGIYMLALGFIGIIRNLYAIQLKRRYETERKIASLQLSGIKAQMEPHFIFNVINSIGSTIYQEKKEEAYQLVLRFSSMVRSMLSSSDKLHRTLHEEIEFVTNYLELERQRFPELYTYSVRIDDDVDRELLIPKMILQLHAENAIKHGLRPMGINGVLEIEISRLRDYLVITIKDNGIGRHAASRLKSQSTGKGMKILEQLYETYNKFNAKPITQEITDLVDEQGKPAGTLVKIRVPVEYNESIYS